MTSPPKEPHTQIKPHLSTHRVVLTKHGNTAPLTKGSAKNKVFEAALSVTAISKMVPKRTSASNFSDILKPTSSPHRSATKSAHPVSNGISNMLSLTIPRLAITAGFLRSQPRFTVNTSTLSLSIIYSASNRGNKFSTSFWKARSLIQTPDEREQEKHIKPADIFESTVKDPLTSNMIENVAVSSPVNPAPPQQMYNDSSSRSPTAEAVSSEAHVFTGQLQPHQGQCVHQISHSSSSDMTSDQKCSFKLSEETAHLDASHALVDDNGQRSVQTLMASMSPEAKNNQFPLSSVSPLPNPVHFGGDSLPSTYSLTGLGRSVSENEILRSNSGDENVNSGSGHAESLLETAGDSNQTDENDSMQTTVATAVEHSDAATKQMIASRDEENSFSFIEQTVGRNKHQATSTDESNSLSVTQSEKLIVKNTNEKDHTKLLNVGRYETVKPTLDNNYKPQLEGSSETSTKFMVFAVENTHETEHATNENVWPVTNDFASRAVDTKDHFGKTALTESDNLPKNLNTERKAAKTTLEQHLFFTLEGVNAVTQIHFTGDTKVPSTFTLQTADQVMDATSEFHIITTKTSDSESLASTNGPIVSTGAHESVLTTRERATTETSTQAAHAKRIVQTNTHIELLSLRESTVTPTPGTPAVKRKNVSETQNVEQTEHEISVQAGEQSQHALPNMVVTTRLSPEPVQDAHGLFKGTYRTGGKHENMHTMGKRKEYLTLKNIKTPSISALNTLYTADRHRIHELLEKTPMSQVKPGAMTDSAPHAAISQKEIIRNTSCSTIGCTKSGESTKTTIGADEMDHTAAEIIMYKPQARNTGDHLNGPTLDTKVENSNCSTNCPVTGNAPSQAANLHYAVLSPAVSVADTGRAPAEEPITKNAKSVTDEISTKTWREHVEMDHQNRGTRGQARVAEKPTQRHFHIETYEAQKANETEILVSEPKAPAARPPLPEEDQLNMGVAETEIFEEQNATRSVRAAAGGETSVQESGRRLLLLEPQSDSELLRLKHRRSASPHLHLPG